MKYKWQTITTTTTSLKIHCKTKKSNFSIHSISIKKSPKSSWALPRLQCTVIFALKQKVSFKPRPTGNLQELLSLTHVWSSGRWCKDHGFASKPFTPTPEILSTTTLSDKEQISCSWFFALYGPWLFDVKSRMLILRMVLWDEKESMFIEEIYTLIKV